MSSTITCKGFTAAGVDAAIKKPDVLDLGLIYSQAPATAAGVFTKNRVQAAPVLLSKQRIAGRSIRAIIVNAGNANCCTGPQGMEAAHAMTVAAAEQLNLSPEEILVASTGVIGKPLPVQAIQNAAPRLAESLRPDGFDVFARAIMTTDTVPKLASRTGMVDGRPFSIVCAAKGAGMIRPDMATMLCFICTDLGVDATILQSLLSASVDRTLNCITIDGDTSTNDTVLVLANGMSGAFIQTASQQAMLRELFDDLLMEIAKRLVKDGEGVTKLVDINVRGAVSDQAARTVADTVANSSLVKTAFFGEDANWGRIVCAVGRSGVAVDPQRIDLFFDQVQMVTRGLGCGRAAEDQVTAILKKPEFSVTIDLNMGNGRATVLTCDFSVDYVKINADYRT